LVSEKAGFDKNNKLYGKLERKKIPVHYLKDTLFTKVAETENSQGIAAVVHKRKPANIDSLLKSKLVIALDRINDPGNLGTIIRTAYWFGVDAVITGENSVDIYNPKVLRSTQGGMFHVNIIENMPLEKTLVDLCSIGFNVYLLDVKAPKNLEEIKVQDKIVFVFGNETDGISKNILNKGYQSVKIEGYSNCESLNVAVSCGIVLQCFRNKG
jgi:TrmH family RNA methyltransferase